MAYDGAFGNLNTVVRDCLDEMEAELDVSEVEQLQYQVETLKQDLIYEKESYNSIKQAYDKLYTVELTRTYENMRSNASFMDHFARILKEEGRIPSIKYIRNIYKGLGLKDAKDFMDNCIEQLKLEVKF